MLVEKTVLGKSDDMKKSEFMAKINKAKKYYEKAQLAEKELFEYLEQEFPSNDLEDIVSKAENSDNIRDSITCYLYYDEYDPDSIYGELEQISI